MDSQTPRPTAGTATTNNVTVKTVDSNLVDYYVKRYQSSSSPTSVIGAAANSDDAIIDGSSHLSPETIRTIAKDFLTKVLGRAINHYEYRDDGGALVCGTADLGFALESMARDYLLRQERQEGQDDAADPMDEEEDQDDDEYVPEGTPEDAEDGNEDKLADDAMNEDADAEDEDEDFVPSEEDADLADDEDAAIDAEDEDAAMADSDENQPTSDGSGGNMADWKTLVEREAPVFATLFPISAAATDDDACLKADQFKERWAKACSELNSVVDFFGSRNDEYDYDPCRRFLTVALGAYLAKVVPDDGAMTTTSSSRIAFPFVDSVMKVALIHMGYSHRMTCRLIDFCFALDFYARGSMQSRVLSVLEREEVNACDTPLFDSLFPSIANADDGAEDGLSEKEENSGGNGGLSYVQIQDLWNEALLGGEGGERSPPGPKAGSSMRLSPPLDVAVYRPLKRAMDAYIVAAIRPPYTGEEELAVPRVLDGDLSKHA